MPDEHRQPDSRPAFLRSGGLGPAVPCTAATAPPAPQVHSAALLQGRNVVHIEHNGALYQLRSTRLGKLILTK
ncbi:hemin uptake protein HemP [Methylibium sp. T29]|uniref:hemin uptake protein HemP n=1 Tax=Methylibium sp. T29 TaxID=1430884 RepID=UPI0009DE91A0|nr:hemin uptake protein HemP [Methylibium sp. T29]